MDVLYILGSGSQWENNELRYSLRSLERFGRNVDRVFVTGEDPGFLSDKVIFNHCPDPGSRSYNHVYKVRWTIMNTDISERFLLNYDDNFFQCPVDIEQYPFFFKGMLPDTTETHRSYRYSLINARKFLEKNEKTIYNFSVHCPCIYERDKFLALEDAWDIAAINPHGIAVRAVYCNWFDMPPTYLPDCKLKTVKSKEEACLAIAGRSVFSIHDNSIANGVGELLAEMFPKKSSYET